jgi:hypothetical protein
MLHGIGDELIYEDAEQRQLLDADRKVADPLFNHTLSLPLKLLIISSASGER